jgi:hypothetical protein
VDISAFWDVIETARTRADAGQPFDQVLTEHLAALPGSDILGFQQQFDHVRDALYRWDLWAAAYLIGGGCSDDGFIDFRAGIIGQGRDWHDRVTASPDSLAGHPVVARAPGPFQGPPLFYEGISYAAAEAWEQVKGADSDFYDAIDRSQDSDRYQDGEGEPVGEHFDFDDPAEMRRRLPLLASHFASGGPG